MQTSDEPLAAKTKIATCEKVTAAVSEATRQAAHLLREGADGRILVNFYGVFTDPHKRYGKRTTVKK